MALFGVSLFAAGIEQWSLSELPRADGRAVPSARLDLPARRC